MGTRSLTVFEDSHGREIVVLYRQMDGYPSGHGQELAEFLSGFTVVNGLGQERKKVANGSGCLAAQVIAHFKGEEAGQFYLHAAGTRDCGEEWIYTVSRKDGGIWLKVQAGAVTFFGLPGTKQENMPLVWEGKPEDFVGKWIEAEYDKKADSIPNDFLNAQG